MSFITIEGVEGAGKSTIIKFIADHLKAKAIDFILTREPGGTIIAEEIRQVLLQHHQEKMTPVTELLLMFASRAQHVATVIKPALQSGKTVICDRFTDASFAYQGGGRGIPEKNIAFLETLVQEELRPDLVIVLDVDAQTGLQRATKHRAPDRIEKEKVDFFNRVRKTYLGRAKLYPHRYRVINATQPLSGVKEEVAVLLDTLSFAGK